MGLENLGVQCSEFTVTLSSMLGGMVTVTGCSDLATAVAITIVLAIHVTPWRSFHPSLG